MNVHGLWVRSEKQKEMMKSKYNIPIVTTNWEELVQHPEIDVISVVTPPHLHKGISIAALKAGKHVICDKPFTLSVADAELMHSVAKAHPNQISWVDHELRFVPTFQKMQNYCKTFGPVLSVQVVGTFARATNTAVGWWGDKALGGGLLGAIGTHWIDLVGYLTGYQFATVYAQLHTQQKVSDTNEQFTSDDWFSLTSTLVSPTGHEAPAVLTCQTLATGPSRMQLIIRCVDGTLTFLRDDRSPMGSYSVKDNYKEIEVGVPEAPPEGIPPSTYIYGAGTFELMKELKQRIDSGDLISPHAATFHSELQVQHVVDSAHESSQSKQVIRLL